MTDKFNFIYIAGCLVFTVYGQLILKWRINSVGELPASLISKGVYLTKLIIFDPFVLSGFLSAFIASLFWMVAMSKYSLSFAYPFMGLAFVFVMFASALFFSESLNLYKIIGTFTIVSGLIILSQGS